MSSLFYLAALITYTKCCRSKRSTGNDLNANANDSLWNAMLYVYIIFAGWKSLILSMFFVFTAMLCKEQGITATAVCVLYEIFVVQKVNSFNLYLGVPFMVKLC